MSVMQGVNNILTVFRKSCYIPSHFSHTQAANKTTWAGRSS